MCVPIACKFILVTDGNDTYVKACKAVSEQPYCKKSWKNVAANNLKVNMEPKHMLQYSVLVKYAGSVFTLTLTVTVSDDNRGT